jgi:hypothetical protein
MLGGIGEQEAGDQTLPFWDPPMLELRTGLAKAERLAINERTGRSA